MDLQEVAKLRVQKDQFFKTHPQSPLTDEQKETFNGLNYFDFVPGFALEVELTRFDKQENVQIQTTTGETRWYLRYGEFRFMADGKETRLTVYKMPPDNYFLPFVDSLAGQETYPAGRYLEPVPLGDDRFRVDFNQAYNPYCAYAPTWNCPITPAENRLSVPIRAGERLPDDVWVIK